MMPSRTEVPQGQGSSFHICFGRFISGSCCQGDMMWLGGWDSLWEPSVPASKRGGTQASKEGKSPVKMTCIGQEPQPQPCTLPESSVCCVMRGSLGLGAFRHPSSWHIVYGHLHQQYTVHSATGRQTHLLVPSGHRLEVACNGLEACHATYSGQQVQLCHLVYPLSTHPPFRDI